MKNSILLLLFACAALAGDGTLSVSPAVVMLRGESGQSTKQTMVLTNGASQPFSFEMKAKDVVVRDGQRVMVEAGELPGSIAATATFSQKLVTVPPGETVRVDVTVTIPPSPAGRAIVAMFQGKTRSAAGVTASLGMLLTFTLSDDVAADASALTVHPPTPTANLSVVQHLRNSGSEPVVAKGMLAIVNASGALIGKQALPPRRLLPAERFQSVAEYAGDLAPGRYRALVTYDAQGRTISTSAEFEVR